MKTLVLQMVEFCKLALINMDRFAKLDKTQPGAPTVTFRPRPRASLVQTRLLACTQHPLECKDFSRGAGLKRFLTVTSP